MKSISTALASLQRFALSLLIILLAFSPVNHSVAQTSKNAKNAKMGKSSSVRSASKRKSTKAGKRGKKKRSSSTAKRKKVTTKGKKTTAAAAKTAAPAAKRVAPAATSSPRTSEVRATSPNGMPSDVAFGTAARTNTVSNSATMSPNEPIVMRSVLEKNDQETLQELFGFDASNRDTAFLSPYWLGQMRFTIPEQHAKIFPTTSIYEDSRTLSIQDMDATQRILPNSSHYEGYVVTPHRDPQHYYLYLYNRAQKRMISAPQRIASNYDSPTMHHKAYSYIFEDANGKLKMLLCTRTARIESDTCMNECLADYRMEGFEFNGVAWQTKYIVQQYRSPNKVVTSSVSCGDANTRSLLEARANALIAYYFRKKD